MYLIINDIYSIYFPYFRLFLNCLLVDKGLVQQPGGRRTFRRNRPDGRHPFHPGPDRKG